MPAWPALRSARVAAAAPRRLCRPRAWRPLRARRRVPWCAEPRLRALSPARAPFRALLGTCRRRRGRRRAAAARTGASTAAEPGLGTEQPRRAAAARPPLRALAVRPQAVPILPRTAPVLPRTAPVLPRTVAVLPRTV